MRSEVSVLMFRMVTTCIFVVEKENEAVKGGNTQENPCSNLGDGTRILFLRLRPPLPTILVLTF